MLKRLMTFLGGLPRWLAVIGVIVVTLGFVAAGVHWTGMLKDPEAEKKAKVALFKENLKKRAAELDDLKNKLRLEIDAMKDIQGRLGRDGFVTLTCQDHEFLESTFPALHRKFLDELLPKEIRAYEQDQPNAPNLGKLRILRDRYLRGGVAELKCR